MKKNIQINLYGTLYNIDEDAYQLLENYIESMKRYFRQQEGGEEIADDIEHRVAELLWAKKAQGMEAIDKDTVKEIMSQIGKAEEIDGTESTQSHDAGESTSSSFTQNTEEPTYDQGKTSWWDRWTRRMDGRRLYRDGQDKVLGGVCSGLAHYFKAGDPVFWRLAFLIPLIFHGSGILLYLILWIIIPEARTPEDRLKMNGRPLNQENLNDQIINDSNYVRNTSGDSARGCLRALLLLLIGAPLLFLLFIIFCIVVPAVMGALIGGASFFANTPLAIVETIVMENNYLAFGGLICIMIIIIAIIYLLLHTIRNKKRLSASALTAIIALILLCFVGATYCISNGISQFVDRMSSLESKWDNDWDDDEEADSDTIYCDPVDTLEVTN